MRAKKTTEPPRLIRYLLSADRRLQRISLKKLSAKTASPEKKARNAPRAARARRAGSAHDARGSRWRVDPRTAVAAAILIVVGAALIAARQPSRQTRPTIADVQPGTGTLGSRARLEQPRAAAGPRPDAKKTVAPKAAAVESARAVPLSASTSTATADPVADSLAVSAAATPASSVEDVASVTITGCLEHDDDTFWLTDTAGADAPTSRSWKSGFLRKRPSRIELVDAGHSLRLPNYVGQRIAASGTLVNREMQTRSLYRVATTCS